MVPTQTFVRLVSALLLGASLVSSNPTPLDKRLDCTGVGPSPGGQPCGGSSVMTCTSETTWSCPNGSSGNVPANTVCKCNAFRSPDWIPNNALKNPDGTTCTSGIVCVSNTQFRVCGVSGLEVAQNVPPGTVCRNGGITWP